MKTIFWGAGELQAVAILLVERPQQNERCVPNNAISVQKWTQITDTGNLPPPQDNAERKCHQCSDRYHEHLVKISIRNTYLNRAFQILTVKRFCTPETISGVHNAKSASVTKLRPVFASPYALSVYKLYGSNRTVSLGKKFQRHARGANKAFGEEKARTRLAVSGFLRKV